jgi:hypothetical protein
MKNKKILWILILALILLVVITSKLIHLTIMLQSIDEVSSEQQPYKNIITKDTVAAISVLDRNHDEYSLEYQSSLFRRSLALVRDIRIYGKHFGMNAPENAYDCGLHIYMTDGTSHIIWLNSITELWGDDIAYITLDGCTYIIESWRLEELYETVILHVIPDQLSESKKEIDK